MPVLDEGKVFDAGAPAGQDMPSGSGVRPLWIPDPEALANASITRFGREVASRFGVDIADDDYPALWRWSVDHLEDFWATVWDFFGVESSTPYEAVLKQPTMPGAQWFPGATLNYAQHALRSGAPEAVALVAVAENGGVTRLSWAELRRRVGSFAQWLRDFGVQPGERVVGYLPNTEHAVIAFLGTAAIGAVWSCCGPDYAADGAAARLAQLEPAVLVATDGYFFGGKTLDRRDQVRRLAESLPTLRAVVGVPYLSRPESFDSKDFRPELLEWRSVTAGVHQQVFEPMPFDAPLWVLFSSGTTGIPKGIVHGHGGVLVEHLKSLGLQFGLEPGDVFFWYTTTNWMMWNMVVGGLLRGATIVTYDGSPAYPAVSRLWDITAEHGVTAFGTSPGYLQACEKAGIEPGRDLDLSALKMLGSSGSPLPEAAYHWVHAKVGGRVQVHSGSGGTDVVSGFAGSAPSTPVFAGEISGPALGIDLQAWGPDGAPVPQGEVGELVVAAPMPSMPLYFWNDADGSRYREAYFAMYPGAWRHGDWISFTEHGGVIVTGRSDSTLNRNGVRMGSADIYAAVDPLPEIVESLVVGVELADGGYWMPLFVRLVDGVELDDGLRQRISSSIRAHASPRHVPDEIIQVPGIPHTRTGKRLEVPVKRVLQGTPIPAVAGVGAIDDPAMLEQFVAYARRGPGM